VGTGAKMKKCNIEQMTDSLVSQLKGYDLPADFEPVGDYWEIIAHIRHTYTNYEQLLYVVGEACLAFQEENDYDYCISVEEEGLPCPISQDVHDELKWEAQDLAQQLYDERKKPS
jgi:hypothetical protein